MTKNTVGRLPKQKVKLYVQRYDVIAELTLAKLLLKENSEQRFNVSVLFNFFGKRMLFPSIWKKEVKF